MKYLYTSEISRHCVVSGLQAICHDYSRVNSFDVLFPLMNASDIHRQWKILLEMELWLEIWIQTMMNKLGFYGAIVCKGIVLGTLCAQTSVVRYLLDCRYVCNRTFWEL